MAPEIEGALEVLKTQGDKIKFVFFAMNGQFFIASVDNCEIVKVVGQLEMAKAYLIASVQKEGDVTIDPTQNKQVLNLAGGFI
jgi:hypothetical protein